MFSNRSKFSLARAAILKDVPVYVQFYLTARCNLTCQQCNIIHANADVREVTINEIERIADNLARLGVAIVLLTGGEPFMRRDLPEIIRAFESRGVHVRMQTNGFATRDQIEQAVAAGGRDISISLDSLKPASQDFINGGFKESWHQALRAMALFTQILPKDESFAALGCVIQRKNLDDIEDVIRFGSRISWFTSLVPVHVTSHRVPRGFRVFDEQQRFTPDEYDRVDRLLANVRKMKEQGYLLYDSDQYLDDIGRFVRNEPTTWRDKKGAVCDSPNLYFAILPNGDLAPCCDHRLDRSIPTYHPSFVEEFNSRQTRAEIGDIVGACEGCMYGSYPEITISMRFLAAKIQRIKTFVIDPPEKCWPLEYEELLEIAEGISAKSAGRTPAFSN